MDAERFDAWARALRSRRSALLGLAGGLAGVAGLLRPADTLAAPCGKRKKRCDGKCIAKNKCCGDGECDNGENCHNGRCRCPAGQQPCRSQCLSAEGTPCSQSSQCCSRSCDSLVGGGTCSPCEGLFCNAQYPCCPGTECRNSRCGGCLARGIVCSLGGIQCCQSDCASVDGGPNRACLSNLGGRCKYDPDCAECYFGNASCNNACVDGVCRV